jgi:hypothetical protein
MAQSTCGTAIPVVVGDNAYACDAAFGNQLTQSSLAGGTTTIYKAGWFAFTPSASGSYTLGVCGSNVDTKMAIGTVCPAGGASLFSVIAYNDDSCAYTGGTALWASRLNAGNSGIPLTSNLQAGVTYYIVVGGYGAATLPAAGSLSIGFTPPPPAGSNCAEPLVAAEGANAFDSTDSTTAQAITGCGANHTIYKSMYFTFTATATDTYTFSTCTGTGFDTRIAVMNDCDPINGVLACNDDACALQSSTSTALVQGQTVTVVVGGFAAAGGGVGNLSIAAAGSGGGGGGVCDPATNVELFVGPNDFATVAGSGNLDLTGICDPGIYGDDLLYNVSYYRFTPTVSDIWTVTTCTGTTWDTRLAVLGTCDPFSTIACNDDDLACANFTSTLEFTGTAGVEVVIAVGGYAATNSGPGVVTIIQGSTAIPCGDPTAGDCCVANLTPSCNDEACCNSVCAADVFCCDVEWDQACADQAAFLCGACGAGSCQIGTGTVAEFELCGQDTNGGCNAGGAAEIAAVGDVITGTFWADADFRDTDWYVLSLTEATEVTVTIKANMPCFTAFVDLACGGILGTASSGNCGGTTTFCFAPGDYYIVALPTVFAGFPCGFEFGNDYSLTVTGVPCDASAPANDNCADAAVAVVGANPFNNLFAGTEYAVPTCGFGGAPFTKDVWFSFTPTTASTFTFETCSGPAPFDTGIEIWDACPSQGGTIINCNDDGTGCAAFASSLDQALVAGVTVYVRVGGWDGATGATDLVISEGAAPPANDECASAAAIGVGSTAFNTAGATGTTVACLKFNNQNIYNDLWYSYVATGEGNCTISTCGASFDTKIAVFDGCSGALIACNDDSATCGAGTLQSSLTFAASCGVTYKISVGAFGVAGFGSGTISLTQEGNCGAACPADFDGDGFVSAADLSLLLAAWGGSAGDVDGDGFTNAADLSLLLAAWGACP